MTKRKAEHTGGDREMSVSKRNKKVSGHGPHSSTQKTAITEVTSVTQLDKSSASKLLKQHNWNVDAAVNATKTYTIRHLRDLQITRALVRFLDTGIVISSIWTRTGRMNTAPGLVVSKSELQSLHKNKQVQIITDVAGTDLRRLDLMDSSVIWAEKTDCDEILPQWLYYGTIPRDVSPMKYPKCTEIPSLEMQRKWTKKDPPFPAREGCEDEQTEDVGVDEGQVDEELTEEEPTDLDDMDDMDDGADDDDFDELAFYQEAFDQSGSDQEENEDEDFDDNPRHYFFSNPNNAAANPLRANLNKVFDKYREDAKNEPDEINVEGTGKLLGEMQINLEDIGSLVFSELVQSPSLGKITRDGFVDGCSDMNVDSIPKIRNVVLQRRAQLPRDRDLYKQVYIHTFTLALQGGQKSLPVEMAVEFWKMLFSSSGFRWATAGTPWLEWWVEFMEDKFKKAVNKDLWKQTLTFAEETLRDETLGFWTVDSSWPSVIDTFVEWVKVEKGRGGGGGNGGGEEMDTA